MSKPPARLTARSVVLSTLLGTHPAHATAAELIRLTEDFGIKETTLRATLQNRRFGELREGVWMRPDNIELDLAADVRMLLRVLSARDDAPVELAGRLWDLPGWVRVGQGLLDELAATSGVSDRFVVAAAIVRHLLTDPMLPAELLPQDWPGAQLRTAYADFAAEMAKRRNVDQPVEAR